MLLILCCNIYTSNIYIYIFISHLVICFSPFSCPCLFHVIDRHVVLVCGFMHVRRFILVRVIEMAHLYIPICLSALEQNMFNQLACTSIYPSWPTFFLCIATLLPVCAVQKYWFISPVCPCDRLSVSLSVGLYLTLNIVISYKLLNLN